MTKKYYYDTGKIYCIKARDCNKCYVGHTKQPLQIRLGKHKTDFKGFYGFDNLKKRNYRSSFEILCEGDFEIFLLQDFPCTSRKELAKQEAKWIIKMSDMFTVTNKLAPYKLNNDEIEEIKDLHIPKCFSSDNTIAY